MPPIRSIRCIDNLIEVLDYRGVPFTLVASAIPPQHNTIAKVETYINTVWIPANVSGYQMQVHVTTLSPLRVILGTWNAGLTIPPNWWVDG